MGNRLLRKKVAARLRELGVPFKVYRGKGYRYPCAAALRRFLWMTQFKVGDIVNDCDANNHRIAETPKIRPWTWGRDGYAIEIDDQFVFEDGRWSCGCPAGVALPWTREEIEQYHIAFHENMMKTPAGQSWLNERSHRLYAILKGGGHIHDNDGVLLAEHWE